MRPLLLALLACAVPAAAQETCELKTADYVSTYMIGGRVGWFDRADDGRVDPSASAAAAIQAGPAQGADLGEVTSYRVAQELAQYAGELDLPPSLKVGVGWFKAAWTETPIVELVVAEDTGCIKATLDLRAYKPLWVRSAPTAAHIDGLPVDGRYPVSFMQEGCGSSISGLMGSAIRPGGYEFEAQLKKAGQASQEIGNSGGELRIAGRATKGYSFSLYSWDVEPKVVIAGAGVEFHVPMYMVPPPLYVTPARLIVQCRGESVDLLYVSGDKIRRYRDIPVELK